MLLDLVAGIQDEMTLMARARDTSLQSTHSNDMVSPSLQVGPVGLSLLDEAFKESSRRLVTDWVHVVEAVLQSPPA